MQVSFLENKLFTFIDSETAEGINGYKKNRMCTSIIATTALVQLGSGMVFVIHSILNPSPAAVFVPISNWTFKIELAAALICDLVISGSLIYYFRNNMGVSKKTEIILHKLIVLSIEECVLLSLITIISFILCANRGNSSSAMPSKFVVSKLYVNSLLATLNSRKGFREMAQDISISMSMVSIHIDGNDGINDSA